MLVCVRVSNIKNRHIQNQRVMQVFRRGTDRTPQHFLQHLNQYGVTDTDGETHAPAAIQSTPQIVK